MHGYNYLHPWTSYTFYERIQSFHNENMAFINIEENIYDVA